MFSFHYVSLIFIEFVFIAYLFFIIVPYFFVLIILLVCNPFTKLTKKQNIFFIYKQELKIYLFMRFHDRCNRMLKIN